MEKSIQSSHRCFFSAILEQPYSPGEHFQRNCEAVALPSLGSCPNSNFGACCTGKSAGLALSRTKTFLLSFPLTPFASGSAYLITLSALASTFGGIVRPICFAVFEIDDKL